jgi:hypothetical protein
VNQDFETASHGFEFTFQARPIPTAETEEVAGDNKETEIEEVGRDNKETCEASDDEGNENNWMEDDKAEQRNYSPPPSPTRHATSSPISLSVARDPSEARDTNTKQLYSERITNTPPASPQKKRNCVQATSSIRDTLEIVNDPIYGSPKGLLHFWKKGS